MRTRRPASLCSRGLPRGTGDERRLTHRTAGINSARSSKTQHHQIRFMIKIGINGFGRIGRLVFRAICDQGLLGKEIEVVAVNDLVPADNLAYLVKYDSTQGRAKEEVFSKKSKPELAEDDVLVVDGHEIKCLAVKEGPAALPWKALGVDIVIESTGLFTEAEKAKGHIAAGGEKGN